MGGDDFGWRRYGSLSFASSFVVLILVANLPSARSDEAPTFIIKPSNSTVRNGMNVNFKCKASGFPSPDIKWYKKGRRVTSWMLRHHIGFLFKTLYIIPVYWSDAGQITCEATNRAGTIRAHAYLRVVSRYPPTWTKVPQNITLYEGQKFTIPCTADAYPDPTYSWTLKGTTPAGSNPSVFVRLNGDLVIMKAALSMTGPYTCTASNIAGKISKTIYVNILEDPTIIRDPEDAVGVVGQDLSLQCVIIGNPFILVTWEKDGNAIDIRGDTRKDVKIQDWEVTAKLYTLKIRQAKSSDAGKYKCAVINGNDKKISKEANVSLTGYSSPPSVEVPHSTRIVSKGSDAILKCIFTGTPLPQITWFKYIAGYQVQLKKTIAVSSRDRVESSSLLDGVTKTDEGVYHCQGINKAGVATGNITLILPADLRKPELVTSASIFTGIRDHNVSVSCTFTGIPQPEVEWYKDSKEIADELGQVIPGHNNTYIAKLEIPDAEFKDAGRYLCRGLNPHGQAVRNVTLVIKGRPMPPSSLEVEIKSRTLILVTWTPGISGGATVSYTIEYKQNETHPWTTVEAGSNTSKTLTDDDGWYGSVLRVHAENSYGSSKPSAEFFVEGRPPRKENVTVAKNPTSHERSVVKDPVVIGTSVGALLLLVAVLLVLFIVCRRRVANKNKINRPIRPTASVLYTRSYHEEEELLNSSGIAYSYVPVTVDGADALDRQPSAEENQYQTVGKPATWEVPKRCLTMDTELGSGHFGKVVKAFMKTENGRRTVAVKMLKANADALQKKEFLAELDLMKTMKPHPNIVGLIGSCTKGDNPYIIVEYCALGNLQELLRKSQGNRVYSNLAGGSISLTSRDLLSFMWQVARGMNYLASLKLVHRDLATRNVLVDTGNICKIADFGLARNIYEDNQYLKTTEGELPLRWMAIESIFHGITTTESDVWSFGVLMWEIITLGAKPYPGFTREQLISNLHLGYRMPRPPYCKEELYAVIWQCWHKEPSERPNFSMLCRTLNRMLVAEKVLIDLDNLDSKYINANSSGEPILSPETRPECSNQPMQ